jgi:hypothetical protein
VKDKATGLQRNAMAAAFWAMLPGPKMIWEFGELGFDYSINTCGNGAVNAGCRTDSKPPGWPYLADTSRKKLHDVYAAMLKLRVAYPGLAAPANTISSMIGAFKSLQIAGDSLSVAVIGNFDVVASAGNISFTNAGTWFNYFTGEPFTATGSAQSFTLSAGEYRVYINKNITGTVPTAVGEVNYSQNPFGIKVYPNPIAGNSYAIEYQLPEYGKTAVEVVSIRGQRLALADLGAQASGKHTILPGQLPLRLSSLAGGYYILKIVSNGKSSQAGFLVK